MRRLPVLLAQAVDTMSIGTCGLSTRMSTDTCRLSTRMSTGTCRLSSSARASRTYYLVCPPSAPRWRRRPRRRHLDSSPSWELVSARAPLRGSCSCLRSGRAPRSIIRVLLLFVTTAGSERRGLAMEWRVSIDASGRPCGTRCRSSDKVTTLSVAAHRSARFVATRASKQRRVTRTLARLADSFRILYAIENNHHEPCPTQRSCR